jgi:8-oxo-dGTP diphosphatase
MPTTGRRRAVAEDAPELILVAACVLVDRAGAVLLTTRPRGKPLAGLWEFPGGKVESYETPESALIRELKEELGVSVEAERLTPLTFVSHSYPEFHLLMPIFVCRRWQGAIMAREGQEIAWMRPEAMSDYRMPPADEPLKRTLPGLLRLMREIRDGD